MGRSVFLIAGFVGLAMSLGLMGCPKEEPETLDLSGKWIGDIIDDIAGAGVFRAHLVHSGDQINGNWSADFVGEDMDNAGALSGTISGSDIFVTMTPSREDACPYSATGKASTNSITADYVTIDCAQSITGIVDMKRDENVASSEAPPSEWQRSFEADAAVAAIQTADGGYLLATTITDETSDFQIIKIDHNGLESWRKVYAGPANEYCADMVATADNGYILAGATRDVEGNQDAYLLKIDAEGNEAWSQSYGGEESDLANAVISIGSAGYLFVGQTDSGEGDESDVYLVRVDSNGNEMWTKSYGGSDEDQGQRLIALNDGGFVVVGSTTSFGAIGADIYLMRLDSAGDLVWHNLFGGEGDERGMDLLLSQDGAYLIAGLTDSIGQGEFDGYLLKVDSEGNQIWSKTYGGLKNEGFFAMSPAADNGFILAGATESFGLNGEAMYVLRTDADGAMLWQELFEDNTTASAYDVIQTAEGGYLFAGFARFDVNEAYIVKLAAE